MVFLPELAGRRPAACTTLWHGDELPALGVYAETDRISIYVRVQNRFLNEKMRFVVPLASFNVIADEDRGKGMFTAILVALAPQLRGKVDGIVVESIQAPRLAEHLRKRGFLDTNLDGFEREVSPTLFCPLD